jgi:hypothetical protein
MTKEEFDRWFRDNLDSMVELGIMHPNSPWGRTARVSLTVTLPAVERLEARIEKLEATLTQAGVVTSPIQNAAAKKPKRKKVSNG